MRILTTLLLALPLTLSACVMVVDGDDDHDDDDRYTTARRERIDATGATIVEIDAEAGDLVIEGVAGLDDVRVDGTARASSDRMLDDIEVNASRLDGIIRIDADVPRGLGFAELDLVIEVPAGMTVLLKDEGGNISIHNTGSVDVQDDAGDLLLRDIDGDVLIQDDSGEIEVHGVYGNVLIREDGSGDIDVSDIDGDLTVERDGSGRIRYDDIGGRVRLP